MIHDTTSTFSNVSYVSLFWKLIKSMLYVREIKTNIKLQTVRVSQEYRIINIQSVGECGSGQSKTSGSGQSIEIPQVGCQ